MVTLPDTYIMSPPARQRALGHDHSFLCPVGELHDVRSACQERERMAAPRVLTPAPHEPARSQWYLASAAAAIRTAVLESGRHVLGTGWQHRSPLEWGAAERHAYELWVRDRMQSWDGREELRQWWQNRLDEG